MKRNDLPQHGTVWKELEEELFVLKADDIRWRKGIFFTNWPQPGGNVHLAAKEASRSVLPFNTFSALPGTRQRGPESQRGE